jgi:hypothetical protein
MASTKHEDTQHPVKHEDTHPSRSRPSLHKDAHTEDENKFKVTITIVEYYDNGDDARFRMRHFGGEGQNKAILSKGDKVLDERDWSSVTDKHGSHNIDGRRRSVRIQSEE